MMLGMKTVFVIYTSNLELINPPELPISQIESFVFVAGYAVFQISKYPMVMKCVSYS